MTVQVVRTHVVGEAVVTEVASRADIGVVVAPHPPAVGVARLVVRRVVRVIALVPPSQPSPLEVERPRRAPVPPAPMEVGRCPPPTPLQQGAGPVAAPRA